MTEPTDELTIDSTKAELQAELSARELPVSGTKPELIERLAADDAATAEPEEEPAEEEPEETAEDAAGETVDEEAAEADDAAQDAAAIEAADLVDDDGEANVESVAGYAIDARTDLGIFTNWLDGVVKVLADFEGRTTNPAAAGMSAASKRIRDHADDVQRNVAGLTAACQALQNEAIAQAAVEDEEA